MSLSEVVLVLGIIAAIAVAAYGRERSGNEARAAATIAVLQDGMRRYHRLRLGTCPAPTPASAWQQFTDVAQLQQEGVIPLDFVPEPAGAHWQLQVGRYGSHVGIGRIVMSSSDLALMRKLAPRYSGQLQGGALHLAFSLAPSLELGLSYQQFFRGYETVAPNHEICLQT